MGRCLTMLLLIMSVVATGARAADLPATNLPDWLTGQWVVSKVYWNKKARNSGNPETQYVGQTIAIDLRKNQHLDVHTAGSAGDDHLEPVNRFDMFAYVMDKSVCIDFSAVQKQGDIRQFLKKDMATDAEKLGLTATPDRVPYIEIKCGRSLHIDSNDPAGKIEYDPPGPKDETTFVLLDHDKIGMPFDGTFLEFSRKSATP